MTFENKWLPIKTPTHGQCMVEIDVEGRREGWEISGRLHPPARMQGAGLSLGSVMNLKRAAGRAVGRAGVLWKTWRAHRHISAGKEQEAILLLCTRRPCCDNLKRRSCRQKPSGIFQRIRGLPPMVGDDPDVAKLRVKHATSRRAQDLHKVKTRHKIKDAPAFTKERKRPSSTSP